ncbi:MFS transporter [Pseudoroseicyclus tamaricis]|uniref:MFS transporter n=1 Tax=Pseudoroseicyclus tamaricis TaxID=2705421 RepID=A0A6B2JWL8_9RHOB|nr:MFS transporter [Pseudoroseicyclus tamaricis]NDV02295.1 MFS transporter [Pseudoroseicyclus tamaricis]
MGTGRQWWVILALWLAGLGAGAQFAKVSVIFDTLGLSYPEAGAALGFTVSLLSFLGILLGLFAGLIAARIGLKRLLIAGLLLGALVSAFQVTLPPLPVLLASRVVEGLSHLIIVVAAPTLMGSLASGRQKPVAMTLWSTFFGVAFALTALLGRPLAEAYGPGALFAGHALYMAAMAALLAVSLPTIARPADAPRLTLAAIARRHVEAYRSPAMAAPALAWLFYTLSWVSILTVLPGRMENPGFAAAAMPLAGIAVSMTLGLALLRRFPPVPVVMAGFAVAAVCALLLPLTDSPWVPIALVGGLGLVQGANFSAIPALNPEPGPQAIANGAVAQMGNLGNTLGTPILLAAIGVFGTAGLVGFAVVAFGGGIAVHGALARARRRQAAA